MQFHCLATCRSKEKSCSIPNEWKIQGLWTIDALQICGRRTLHRKSERTTWIATPSELVDAPPKAGVRLPPPLVRHPIAKGDQEKY